MDEEPVIFTRNMKPEEAVTKMAYVLWEGLPDRIRSELEAQAEEQGVADGYMVLLRGCVAELQEQYDGDVDAWVIAKLKRFAHNEKNT